jgi:phosphoglycolate phosphatase
MHRIKNIFFDLDGTISDPQEGITKSICYALQKMGHPSIPAPETLTHLIGPPLRDYFSLMLGESKVDEAIMHYRQRYDIENACLTENEIIEGMWFTIMQLWSASKNLFVITTKPTKIAKKILKHLELRERFKGIFGAELDETRSDKTELIARILECRKIAPESAVMIGDRKYDIIGAINNNVRNIGVTWGFGSIEELEEAGAQTIVRQPQDILKILIKTEKVE